MSEQLKIKLDDWNWEDHEEGEEFDETGWTRLGGWDKSDSDSGSHGVYALYQGVNKGFNHFIQVVPDDDEYVELYGRVS